MLSCLCKLNLNLFSAEDESKFGCDSDTAIDINCCNNAHVSAYSANTNSCATIIADAIPGSSGDLIPRTEVSDDLSGAVHVNEFDWMDDTSDIPEIDTFVNPTSSSAVIVTDAMIDGSDSVPPAGNIANEVDVGMTSAAKDNTAIPTKIK